MIKRNRNASGFTVVELMVVIAVIGVLVTIVSLGYREVQKTSRDSLRSTNISTFRNALEKFYEDNGTYPPGCPMTSCTSWFYTENNVTPPITSGSTLATIKGVLPQLPEKFGDPAVPAAEKPIMNTSLPAKKYIYFGGTANLRNNTTTSSTSVGSTTSFPCTLRSTLTASSATSVGSYVVGYYSEADAKWMLYGGKYGTPMYVNSGAAENGCVINR